jgi:hypothetical protein
MNLEKMAMEFADAILNVIRSATLEELVGPTTVKTMPSVNQQPKRVRTRSRSSKKAPAATPKAIVAPVVKPVETVAKKTSIVARADQFRRSEAAKRKTITGARAERLRRSEAMASKALETPKRSHKKKASSK